MYNKDVLYTNLVDVYEGSTDIMQAYKDIRKEYKMDESFNIKSALLELDSQRQMIKARDDLLDKASSMINELISLNHKLQEDNAKLHKDLNLLVSHVRAKGTR